MHFVEFPDDKKTQYVQGDGSKKPPKSNSDNSTFCNSLMVVFNSEGIDLKSILVNWHWLELDF